mgnify:FL=1
MMELLSPAGGWEAMVAAVQNGADAVYMGFGGLNARRSARNFTDEEFRAAVAYCHLRGVKVYLTLNTLVTDRELPAAAEALKKASDMGVDAILIQDWGIWRLAREIAPEVPLHASTQMSLHTLGGACRAAELGLERVVLARELSRRDIHTITRGCPAEIEVFGHGALCMCYSGQCEMSAVIGGRSGNRGACAQPCRLPYGVNEKAAGGHPLSLKDANLADYVQELEQMGVACLKLEGRMKRPEYVAVITGIYRRLLDEKRGPSREESRQLEAAFSRSGFTDGYYKGRTGPEMFGTRPENAPEPKELFARAKAGYSREDSRRVPVDMVCTLRAGEPVSLTASAGGHVVRAEGPTPEEVRNRALTAEELQSRLEKTGGTVFRPRETRVELEEGLMLPASAVNALRRQALEGLEAALTQPPVRRTGTPSPLPQAQPGPDAPVLTCSIMRPEQLTEPLAQCETVYVPAELLEKIDLDRWAEMTHICAVLPRIFRTEDQAALRALLQRHRQKLSAVAIGNLGHLPIAESLGLPLWGDLGLNLFNSESLLFWKELGLESAAVSMELRWQQLRDLRKVLPCEAVVYGRLPLMIMENCVIRNQLGCRDAGRDYADRSAACRCGQENVLVDRTGAQFPLVGQWGHRCEIENSRVLFLADKPEWRQLGLTRARLRFTTESPEECARVLQAYQGRSDYRPDQLTRGLFYRGVE